jgi:hypothetical protein
VLLAFLLEEARLPSPAFPLTDRDGPAQLSLALDLTTAPASTQAGMDLSAWRG